MGVLDTHSLGPCRDEGRAKLKRLVWAEAGSACEALHEASFCHSAVHDPTHLGEHQVDHSQNELGTDLQLGSAGTAAAAEEAGHRHPRGLQEEVAAHMRHTWAVAVRHPARRCAPGRRPASARRRG
jgi:hypothetical protein